MWNELKLSFSTTGFHNERTLLKTFQEAHNFVFVRRRQVQINEVLPVIEQAFLSTNDLPALDFNAFRRTVLEAKNGNDKMLEEVEFAYYFHTSAYEMIFGWSSAGLLGLDQSKAYSSITSVVFNDIDFNSLESLVRAFGQSANLCYESLPPFKQ